MKQKEVDKDNDVYPKIRSKYTIQDVCIVKLFKMCDKMNTKQDMYGPLFCDGTMVPFSNISKS